MFEVEFSSGGAFQVGFSGGSQFEVGFAPMIEGAVVVQAGDGRIAAAGSDNMFTFTIMYPIS